jgi:hypothetical protein
MTVTYTLFNRNSNCFVLPLLRKHKGDFLILLERGLKISKSRVRSVMWFVGAQNLIYSNLVHLLTTQVLVG